MAGWSVILVTVPVILRAYLARLATVTALAGLVLAIGCLLIGRLRGSLLGKNSLVGGYY